MPNGESSTEKGRTNLPNSQSNTLTTSEKSDEAGRGEEGAGEPFVPPTANEVRRFAEALRHPEFDAEWFVAYYTERHWRRHNGRPVVSWQTTARYWLDHPLRVARHLLDHRPAASPVSIGVGGPSAVVVPAAYPAAAKPVAGSASFPSTGTPPVGTGGLTPRASASPVGTGTPHVGSLSLPAPTPLQQSRLSDLKGMVLHLFADAPAAAPTSATTAPDLSAAAADVPANAPTPATAASPSVRPARFISPAEAAQVIAQQTLAAAEAEEIIDTQAFSTPDAAKSIDAQALSPADAEEYVRSCDDSTTDAAKDIETQAFSITEAAKGINAQALSPADAEESVRACDNSTDEDEEDALNGHDSTTDTAKDIDAQVLSPADAEEDALNGHDSTTNAAKGIDALPFSADKGRWGVRSPRGPDPPTGDGHDSTDAGNNFSDTGNDFTDASNDFTDTGNDFADAENHFTAQPSNFSADRHPPAADRHSPAAVGTARAADPPIFAADECRPLRTLTEKHPYLNPSFHEPHPLLRLHPPSFGGFGRTFRVQSAQPPFGRSFLGRFVDIRPACTVGSRPLRPRLALCRTERGRCRPEHPGRERTTSANAAERSANAIRPPADTPEHGARRAKNADFIDADPVRGHKTERNAAEHPADGHEHDAQRTKNADFIDADSARGHQTERNAPEHPADERKRHDPAAEYPAYDPDAGQRVLRSAAHRRAVRAEREACCGALRHLAHCCVAF